MSIDKEAYRSLVKAQSDLAAVLSNYYLELKKVGFSDENAMKLTVSYQESILIGNNDNT